MTLPHLNRALALEAAEKQGDGAGGFTETWHEIGVLWAEVKAGSGRERERESVGTARIDYRITVRAAPEGSAMRPVAGQRFREGLRVFRILAVADHETQGRFLQCYAAEETAS